jgi:hypothetical protein
MQDSGWQEGKKGKRWLKRRLLPDKTPRNDCSVDSQQQSSGATVEENRWYKIYTEKQRAFTEIT